MRVHAARLIANPRLRAGADAAVAIALACLALVDILGGSDASWGGGGRVQIVLALAVTLPLAWRVRFPIPVMIVVNAASTAVVVLAWPHQAAFEPFVAAVIAAYSLGAHTAGRRAIVGIGLMLSFGIGSIVATAVAGQPIGNLAAPCFWLLGTWIVGRIIHGRRRRTMELEALTQELARQRDLQAQAAVAVERGRIARELHDIVAHNVSMMVVQAGAAAQVLEGQHPDVGNALNAIAETGRATVNEMRTLLGVLRAGDTDDAPLNPQPGIAELEQLVRSVREAGLPVELQVEGEPTPLPQALDLSAFRIVQEALTNTLRHAGRARAKVVVRYHREAVEVEVQDDGSGDDGTPLGGGHGLIGIRERVLMLNGEVEAGRCAEGGFRIRARLPIPASVTG
jgi:signal transduction histidine kinase